MVWSSAAPQHEISMSQVWHTDATVPAEPLNRGDACVRVCVCVRARVSGELRERERERAKERGESTSVILYLCRDMCVWMCASVYLRRASVCVRSCINTYVHH